jgi:hypothetical protein
MTSMSDSAVVSDGFRYVFSPGTMLAQRFVKVQESHRGLGAFLDALHAYTNTMAAAMVLNEIFYGLLIFGIVTIVAAVQSAKADFPLGSK